MVKTAKGEECLISGTATVHCHCTFDFLDAKAGKWGGRDSRRCRNASRWREDHAVEYVARETVQNSFHSTWKQRYWKLEVSVLDLTRD